jgi:hypothetical protein
LNADNPREARESGRSIAQDAMIKGNARRAMLGFGPEELRKASSRPRVSATHVGVIEDHARAGTDEGRAGLLRGTESQINGEQIVRIEKALKEGSDAQGRPDRKADAIIEAPAAR